MMWNDGMTWTGWLYMGVTALAFWALVVFAVVSLFRGTRTSSDRGREADFDAAQILDQRFARGEIDADEYHARRNVLHAAH